MKKKVLIVDDQASMRRMIRVALAADPRLEVVADASCAEEARAAINTYKPDVLTLDVEMPNMNGLEFLKRVMKQRPMPVVMVSTLTRRGSDTAVAALAAGAVDCVEKPKSGVFSELARKVYDASHAKVNLRGERLREPPVERAQTYEKICLIGGSTGAVDAIEHILARFPKLCPPTVITQHMPAQFLVSFAERLNRRYAPSVKLAETGDSLQMGQVFIAPGGETHVDLSDGAKVKLITAPPMSGHRPSVDYMFKSAVPHARNIVASLLTGMGRDGAEGIAALRKSGARTLGQSRQTCVVFGMPRVAGELGGIEKWADIQELGEMLLDISAPNTQNKRASI